MGYRIINGKICPIKDISPENNKQKIKNIIGNKNTTFNNLLEKEIEKTENLTISKHATERLKSRNIHFDNKDIKLINEGIDIAKNKGANDSVILYKDIALVTSIKNRTIVTAIEKNSDKKIFTNIDSVVFL